MPVAGYGWVGKAQDGQDCLPILLNRIFDDACHFIEQLLCDRQLMNNTATPYYR